MELVQTAMEIIQSIVTKNYWATGTVVTFIILSFFPPEKQKEVGRKATRVLKGIFGLRLGPKSTKKILRRLFGVVDNITDGALEELKNNGNGGNNG